MSASDEQDATQLLNELYEWQTPVQMQARVDALFKLLGYDALQRRGKAYREAWVAARFAARTEREAVRLLRETGVRTTPDFAVRSSRGEQQFEITEADVPGRRRQAEYREPRPAGVEPMIFTSLTVMVAHIQMLATKKAAKVYENCAGLVIHMNPPMFSFNPLFRAQQLLEATQPAAAAFDEVWMIRDQGVLLWKGGKPCRGIPDDF